MEPRHFAWYDHDSDRGLEIYRDLGYQLVDHHGVPGVPDAMMENPGAVYQRLRGLVRRYREALAELAELGQEREGDPWLE